LEKFYPQIYKKVYMYLKISGNMSIKMCTFDFTSLSSRKNVTTASGNKLLNHP